MTKGDVAAAILHEIEDQPVCTSPTGQTPTTWISKQVGSILSTQCLELACCNKQYHIFVGKGTPSNIKGKNNFVQTVDCLFNVCLTLNVRELQYIETILTVIFSTYNMYHSS